MGKKSFIISISIIFAVVIYFIAGTFLSSPTEQTNSSDLLQETSPFFDEPQSFDQNIDESQIKETTVPRRTSSSTMLHSSEGSLLKTRKLPDEYAAKAKAHTVDMSGEKFKTHPWLKQLGWKIWSGKVAVLGSDADVKVGGYGVEEGKASTVEAFKSSEPPLVYDESTNMPGVITGHFEVTYNAPVAASDVSYEGVRIISGMPELGVFYMTSATEPFDLRHLKSFLESQANVQNVKLIVKSRSREKF